MFTTLQNLNKMSNIDYEEKRGQIVINTRRWMRPKTACDILQKRGLKVSSSLMNYWINEGKIKSAKIKSLDNLTIVDIETIPNEMRIPIKISK